MILVDANITIYAHDTASDRHARAKEWLENLLGNEQDVRFGLVTLLAFVRVMTSPRVLMRPVTPAEAVGIVATWMQRENVAICEPTERHWPLLADLATKGQARGALLMDAHLAALAIEHGATLATTDRDFARFPGLRWIDPLT